MSRSPFLRAIFICCLLMGPGAVVTVTPQLTQWPNLCSNDTDVSCHPGDFNPGWWPAHQSMLGHQPLLQTVCCLVRYMRKHSRPEVPGATFRTFWVLAFSSVEGGPGLSRGLQDIMQWGITLSPALNGAPQISGCSYLQLWPWGRLMDFAKPVSSRVIWRKQ